MKDESKVIFDRVKKTKAYKQAMDRAEEADRDAIENSAKQLAERFEGLADKLFAIVQDPKLSAKLREELLLMSKNPKHRKQGIKNDGESR